jgi:hypothetical protein
MIPIMMIDLYSGRAKFPNCVPLQIYIYKSKRNSLQLSRAHIGVTKKLVPG